MGIYVVGPSDPGNALRVNEDMVFPTASSIKIAILVEFLRQVEAGLIDPMAPLTLRGEDARALSSRYSSGQYRRTSHSMAMGLTALLTSSSTSENNPTPDRTTRVHARSIYDSKYHLRG